MGQPVSSVDRSSICDITERIYIDVKEIDVSVAGYIVDYIFDKANSLGVASKETNMIFVNKMLNIVPYT